MAKHKSNDKTPLFAFFTITILIGSVLLTLPVAWPGPGRLDYLSALFTATSAVCVTGLIVVNTSQFSFFGQVIVVALIQVGGLGIVTFATLYLTGAGGKISLSNRGLVTNYYVDSVSYRPGRIVKHILILTFVMEAVGAAALYLAFRSHGIENPGWGAVFHAISAFCNAGFSLFDNSLEAFAGSASVLLPIMILVVVGGIGFVVIDDLLALRQGRRRVLSLHTKITLAATACMLVLSAVGFYIFEREALLAGAGGGPLGALFQSVTPRTAGFNTVPQSELSSPALVWTMLLMFIGGAPGSIAGGLKITTFAVIVLFVAKRADETGEIQVFSRRLSGKILGRASGMLMKCLGLIFTAVFALTVTENFIGGRNYLLIDVIFETISAFATVGLSRGITAELTSWGRVVTILTMFAGRVGLITMAAPQFRPPSRRLYDFPEGDILLG